MAGGAAADAGDDLGEGMQCSEHPYRTNPGGICAFCLQEKLGNLLSAAAPNSFFTTTTAALAHPSSSAAAATVSAAASAAADVLLLKASNSVAPRPLGDVGALADSPRKKKHFWSFLYHSSSSAAKINQQRQQESADAESSAGGSQASSSSFGRKVARSRSVGCGSRSFSGDFLERISTGFGDCTLRRVESQREARNRADGKAAARGAREGRVKERARCGGIFRGLGVASASSYWLSSSAAAEDESSRMPPSRTSHRNRSWGWAFASPMRALKPASAASKSLRPANAVAGINISAGSSSSSNSNISSGNPPSSLPVGGGGGGGGGS